MPIYKVATFQVSQSGTNPLTIVNELENTIGAPTLTRGGVGSYAFNFPAGSISTRKPYIAPFGDFAGNESPYLPIWDASGAINGYFTMYPNPVPDQIFVDVRDASGASIDLSDLIDIGTLYLPEIRTYP